MTEPEAGSAQAASTSGPTQSGRNVTSFFNKVLSSSATGAKVAGTEPEVMDLSLKNSGLGEKWEENGFQAEWLMSGMDSVVM
ncbi:hypothetical protein E2C01_010953 [Portunus trituberculatus]|uniref:Uncharacterized protein n=1 Tax=Portunus trituberculatus TaxID=210409 RepID=A0A5B7DA48_PORTR|nr:hypothetical protein [Portunus trituberculatus]